MKNEMLTKLAAPFHPSNVTWKPGMVKNNKALALAYADPRAYQNRLDEVCGMDWSVSFTPWGDRIICHLTIDGITRSSTGEADSQSERSEIAGTAAEAQAFKRACAMFGLGRYLYNLPTLWVEYDEKARGFSENGKARLHSIVAQHYQRWMNGQPAELAEDAGRPDDATVKLLELLNEAGSELYGQKWPEVRAHNAKRLGVAEESLSADNLQTLLSGLRKLKDQRQPA